MTEKAPILDHPSSEGYESVKGPNIEAGWEARAACLGIAETSKVFFSRIQAVERTDQEICSTCPVANQCLLDSLAKKGEYVKQGRRVGMTGEQRRLLDRRIRALFTDMDGKISRAPNAYDGKTKLEFYTEDIRAPGLVHESLRYTEERHAFAGRRVPDSWPTSWAIEIRDHSNS